MSKRLKAEKACELVEYWDNGSLKCKGMFKNGVGNGIVRRWNADGVCTSWGSEKNGKLVEGECVYHVSLASWHVDFECTAKGTFIDGKLDGADCELIYKGCLWCSGAFENGLPVAGKSFFWFFKSCGEYCTLYYSKSQGFYPVPGSEVYLTTYGQDNAIIRTVQGKLRKPVFPLCSEDEEPEDYDPYYPLRDALVLHQAVMRGKSSVYGAIKFKGCCMIKICLNFGESMLQVKCVPHGIGTIYEQGLPRSEFIFHMGFRDKLRSMFDEKGRLALQFNDKTYSDSIDENGWPEYILGEAWSYTEREKNLVLFVKGKLQYKHLSKSKPLTLKIKDGVVDMICLDELKRKKVYWMLNQLPSDYKNGETPHVVSSSVLIQLLKQSRPVHPITRAPIMRCTKVIFV
jgi:hypothetical protein